LDVGAKIDAERNIIDIQEYRFLVVVRDQAIEDAPGNCRRIGAAVRDNDRRH